MNSSTTPIPTTDRSPELWPRRHARLMRLAILLMIGIAGIWISYETWRLLFQETPAGNRALMGAIGAVDLSLRHLEVNCWYAGEPIDRTLGNAVYPPASHLILWPFVGWLSFPTARWLWALVTLVALAFLIPLYSRSAGATSRQERWFLALIPLATYPVGATIGNGQLSILVFLCLLAALPRLRTNSISWKRDLAITALFLFALVKPTMAAPFFWIVLFSAGGLRPAALIGAGYAGLTWLSSIPQKNGPINLMNAWLGRGIHGSAWGAEHGEGSINTVAVEGGGEMLRITSVNLHSVMVYLGHAHLITIGTMLVLVLIGIWVWFHRNSSIWLLMGVVAVVTRFYTYHGWYDDILLLFPLLALFRITRDSATYSSATRVIAGVMFAATLVSILAPGGTYLLCFPWNNAFVVGQAALLLGAIGFLSGVASEYDSREAERVSP